MKRIVLTVVALSFILGGIAFAQSEADVAYITAMQATSPEERGKLLKAFIAQYAGKGSQYENFAYANLALTMWQGKTEQETIQFGEKAIQAGGIDDLTKSQVLMTMAALYVKQGQPDKAKSMAAQLIQTANAAKGKESEAANAATWTQLGGAGHFLTAQALDKAKDVKGALTEYETSYTILKDVKILAEVKKMGKTLYDAQKWSEAEMVYRFLAGTGKDTESLTLVAQALTKQGKQAEALQMYKDMYAKNKTGVMAYNIGIMLANESKTNPAVLNDAIAFLLDASFLYPAQAQKARELAQGLFMSQDKEWNNRVKALQESQTLLNDWTKTINTKFGEKSEEELSGDEKREYRILMQNIEKEQKLVEDIQAQQKGTMAKFEALVAASKKRSGK